MDISSTSFKEDSMPIKNIDIGDVVVRDAYPHITGKVVAATDSHMLVIVPIRDEVLTVEKKYWSLFEKGVKV